MSADREKVREVLRERYGFDPDDEAVSAVVDAMTPESVSGRFEFDREVAAMVGELRDVTIDVGSFLSLSTEATNEQRLALARLVHRYRHGSRGVKAVTCTMGAFGLPASYCGFVLRDASGEVLLNGGIDADGAVST